MLKHSVSTKRTHYLIKIWIVDLENVRKAFEVGLSIVVELYHYSHGMKSVQENNEKEEPLQIVACAEILPIDFLQTSGAYYLSLTQTKIERLKSLPLKNWVNF